MNSCMQGSLCFELVKGIPTGILAFIAVVITYGQYQVAKAKVKLDLFERRLKLFKQISEHIQIASQGSYGDWGDKLTPINELIPEARFLFGIEMLEYLADVQENILKLRRLEHEPLFPSEEDRQKDAEAATKLRKWFRDEAYGGIISRFKDFLDFTEWK